MAVFQSIYNMLLEEGIAQSDQVTDVKHASSVAALHMQATLSFTQINVGLQTARPSNR